MALSLQDVQRIAQLARIEITPAEAEDVRGKLERIFELINEMSAVNTAGIVPMGRARGGKRALREGGGPQPRRARALPARRSPGAGWALSRAQSDRVSTNAATYASVAELGRALAEKRVSSVELTRAALDRIAALGTVLNAFVTVDRQRALAEAAA